MSTKSVARQPIRVGRSAIAAGIAGLAGLILTLAVASSMVFTALGADSARQLEPGYLDYGQRHRDDPLLVDASDRASRLDDYGTRCVRIGWCVTPPGVAQPEAVGDD